MAKPFDATLKHLFREYAADFASLVGATALGPVTVLSPDLSSVSVESDIVLGVGDPQTAAFDVNLQSTWDDETLVRGFAYNALLHRLLRVPIYPVFVLLRPSANDLRLSQGIAYSLGDAEVKYVPRVVRLWEVPTADLLSAGVGVLPLAPLGTPPTGLTRAESLEPTLRRIDARLNAEVGDEAAKHLWISTYLLSGLHFVGDDVAELFRRVRGMKESSTYQYVIAEGKTEEARGIVVLLGEKLIGPCDAATRDAIEAISDRARLERMIVAIPSTNSWTDVIRTL